MKKGLFFSAAVAMLTLPLVVCASPIDANAEPRFNKEENVQVGPRPYFLVNNMDNSPLKSTLQRCAKGSFKKTDFSIGHRGAPMQFPEHTKESYEAGARMGAGILECDVTFTKDKELVCRHSQCDLHTTTNILATPLAEKCSSPFSPAVIDPATGAIIQPAAAQCCASDITVTEFKTLRGKMDASDPRAQTVDQYIDGTANWRTDLYSGPTSGTLLTHKESIVLFKSLDVKMTPELKSPSVPMPFDGFSQEDYAQKMIDEYKHANVSPKKIWAQSFNYDDVIYWITHEPAFGKQAVFLDDADSPADLPSFAELQGYANDGVNIVAPPMWALLALNGNNNIVPSIYAMDVRAAGLDIITWTLERSGILADGDGGWYYQTTQAALNNEGDIMETLHVLARDVGIKGIFSDWPGTVTYYANCMGLRR